MLFFQDFPVLQSSPQALLHSQYMHKASTVLLFPSLLFVLSINVPKNISLTPSNNFDTMINVPTTPGFNPTVFVRYNITNEERNAYTTFPARSPVPYPTLLYHFRYFFFFHVKLLLSMIPIFVPTTLLWIVYKN